jgi:pimeloyl-ACP methyl ester carboxylesterase
VSAIHLDNRLLHFEVVGRRGQPIIFLHSWIGSWRYWLPTMEHVSDRYRTYALDFWGFGESDRHESMFTVSEYVNMLYGFMDHLGLSKVNVVGHGLGGMVAIRAASEQPERFLKLMVVNTPIYGAQMQSVVKPGALSRLLGRANPTNMWARLLRQLDVDYPQILEEILEDTDSLSDNLIQRVIDSILQTDLRPDLARLELPLLAVYGEKDSIVDNIHATYLQEDHGHLQQVLKLPRSNHFPFLDQQSVFSRMMLDFLSSQGTQVEMKAEWRRRVSQFDYI